MESQGKLHDHDQVWEADPEVQFVFGLSSLPHPPPPGAGAKPVPATCQQSGRGPMLSYWSLALEAHF